jgi:hypothetical protein
MKFVKENLTLLICGAVALLILVFAFAPIPYAVPSLKEGLVTKMQHRYAHRDMIKQWMSAPLELPGWPAAKGIPPQSWVDVKNLLITGMNNQQKEVETLAQQYNKQGRVDAHEVPLLPVPQSKDLSQSKGLPMSGFLPKVTGERMVFKENYGAQFPLWRGLLALGALTKVDAAAALPPKPDDLKREFEERQKVAAGNMPAGVTAGVAGGLGGGFGAVASQSSKELWDFEKRGITAKALSLRMYVEDNAFQIRSWYNQDSPPDDTQVFEGFVDSWLQSDLVKAIFAVNSKYNPKDAVDVSPVKRLTRVMIGSNARNQLLSGSTSGGTPSSAGPSGSAGDQGPLFFTGGGIAPEASGVTAMTPVPVLPGNQATSRPNVLALPTTPNQTNYDVGMTGRSAGATYDVVYMSVVMDVDPAYLFRFIDELYRQNMGYTVANIQMRSVDPIDRASNGYLYGNTPVVEVDLIVECILFRGWTEPLMPDAVKISLGGTLPPG